MGHGVSRNTARPGQDAALGLCIGVSLLLAGCGAPEITLPADKEESAALCYGAVIAAAGQESGKSALTVDQLSRAAHFTLLGASLNGVGEPTKVEKIVARGQALQTRFDTEKNAERYAAPCAKAFPETRAGSFKDLPADTPDTRMLCYTLSTALLEMAGSSNITPDPRLATYTKLNGQLDQSTLAEIQAAGNVNPAELAGRAMRGVAQAVQLGPPVDVLDACSRRYVKS